MTAQPLQLTTADETGTRGPAAWITATVRPAGDLGRLDAGRLDALLGALSLSASVVVLDLEVARVHSHRSAAVIDAAADALERRGGCLLCVHADDASRAALASAGAHAVVLAPVGAHGATTSPTVVG